MCTQKMFIKVNFNNATRKIKLDEAASIDQLKAELLRCFGEKVKEMSLGYRDSEDELITISSQEDWEVCVEEAKDKNKGKPTLTVTLQLIQGEDFVTIGDSRISKAEEAAPQDTESEIKEEPKEAAPVEELPENKIIVETQAAEEISERQEEPNLAFDHTIETEIKIPEHSFTQPEDIQNLIRNVTDTLGSVLGISVDVVDARVDQPKEEESRMNDSSMSTLTVEQRNEIEDLIEEKLQKALSLKKDKKSDKKCKKDKKENKKASGFAHSGIICDGCKKGIKDMARFKSLVINDYDLCEECEKTGIHPGPMVKFNAPSSHSPFLLNQKFGELIPFFKGDVEKKNNTCEGFKFFPECPFRGGRARHSHGPHHPRHHAFGPHHRPHGHHGFHNNPLFKNIAEGFKPFGGLFQNIVQNVTAEISKHTQPKAQQPKQETMTESKQAEDAFKALAHDFIVEFPDLGLDVEVLTSIIRENQLLSKDAIMNHLFL